jgi:hypothetical protein
MSSFQISREFNRRIRLKSASIKRDKTFGKGYTTSQQRLTVPYGVVPNRNSRFEPNTTHPKKE